MANVSFKRGLQANLPNSNIVDGAFYLTTDTNRLYVGGANDKLELLNQSIKFYTYDQVFSENSTVPKVEGQFYYLSDKNILCTFAKTKTHPDGEWVQINPDHNDNTLVYVSGLNVTKSNSAEGNTKKLTYTIELNQEKKESSDGNATPYGDAITASFEINSEDLNKIASNVSVGLESKAIVGNENGLVLKTTGGGADADTNIAIVGGDNVNIGRSEDGKTITISSTDNNTTYDLTSPIGSTNIMLNGGDTGQAPTIELSGDDKIIVKGESADQITFNHATSNAAGDYNATNNYNSTNVNKIKVPTFTVDATGHISNASLKEITLPEDKDTTYEITNIGVVGSEGKTGKGKLSISLKASNGEAKPKVSTDDVLYHEITIDGTNYKKLNQESLGNFYSTSKVDELITKAAANMNAMTYKGVIDGVKFSGIKGSQNGDTYKASADFTINKQLVKQGDLVIYNGADTTGSPNANDWDIVPSGDEIDSQFSLSLQEVGDKKTPTFTLRNTTINKDAGVVEVVGNKGIETIFDNGKLIIAHATESNAAGTTVGANTNLTPAAADTIIVPSITYDAQGHITSAEDKAITLPADKDTTYEILTAKYGTSDAAVKLKANGSEGGPESGESPTAVFKAGTSIVLDASSDGIKINHGDPGAAVSNYSQNTTGQVDYGHTFKVPKFSRDAKGHIVNVEDVDITMPSAQVIPSVNFSGATKVENNRATFASTLVVGDGGDNQTYAPSIGSNTLKISGPDDNITIDLEWESF